MLLLVALAIQLVCGFHFTCNFQERAWSRQPRLFLNDREILAPTAHSFSLIVDFTDQIVSQAILESGTWQPQILTLINNTLKPNHKALNLGSQTGLEAVLMGKIIGAEGKMYIFQPYSVSYKMVVKNIYLNDLMETTKVFKLGAGSEKQTMKLWIDSDNTGHSSLVQEAGASKGFEEIEVVQVDSILGDQIIDFALIDVEKFEVQALRGMKGILKRSSSIIAIIQWRYLDGPIQDEAKTKELLEWLSSQNFKWYRYHPAGEPCQIGTIKLLQSQELLKIKEEDLLLAGQHADLSKLLSL